MLCAKTNFFVFEPYILILVKIVLSNDDLGMKFDVDTIDTIK